MDLSRLLSPLGISVVVLAVFLSVVSVLGTEPLEVQGTTRALSIDLLPNAYDDIYGFPPGDYDEANPNPDADADPNADPNADTGPSGSRVKQ